MPESSYFLMLEQSSAMLLRIKDKKQSIRNFEAQNGQLKKYFDLNGWEDMLMFYAFLCVKILEIRFFANALMGDKPSLHNIIFTRKVLISVRHLQERLGESVHRLKYFFLDTDSDNFRSARKIVNQINLGAEKLFSYPLAIPLFNEDAIKQELLEYVTSELPEHTQMLGLISELEVYLDSVLKLMQLIQKGQLENFDSLAQHMGRFDEVRA
ncbi:hypothetical protein [Pedobacter sp. R-06]|uniref:hypothetical protein n=1 Tax=Pedobacter sp. R-06 TaxID=3404051 RepID=UPI003CF78EA3